MIMRVYLMRHGDAVASHPSGDRPLSDLGRQQAERIGATLHRLGIGVHRVVHSGKARARQTAELVSRAIAFDGALDPWGGLNPNDPVAPVAERLGALRGDTIVVGHLPLLAKLVGALSTGEDQPIAEFKPSAVACLTRDSAGHRWRVTWLVQPGLIG